VENIAEPPPSEAAPSTEATPPSESPDAPLRIVAGPEARGDRVDRFLAASIGTISRSRVKSLIEAGQAHRDGTILREPAELVRPGAVYTLTVPPPVPARPAAQSIPFAILYEDDDLIVLDKPAGLVVHPAPGNEDGTLVNALLAHCGDTLPGIGGERRPGIVHRLDKDTSGVMVVAKTQQALAALTATFAARALDRAYLALVWGVAAPLAGEIEGAIGRDRRDRKRMAVRVQGGKAALTRYSTMRVWHGGVSLLECRLATGRTHQIRVHLAASGHPVVGDPVYLRRLPRATRLVPEPARSRLLDFPRQALHAARLGFQHPRTGEVLAFEAPPPADFAALVAVLDGAGLAEAGHNQAAIDLDKLQPPRGLGSHD
jgi:23S rRNA pseudouridine1911/1915/1917 synthase